MPPVGRSSRAVWERRGRRGGKSMEDWMNAKSGRESARRHGRGRGVGKGEEQQKGGDGIGVVKGGTGKVRGAVADPRRG